jgi:sulfatase modifying factor 1
MPIRAELTTMQTKINEKDGSEMVWVPEGDFIMGGDAYGAKPRRTVHTAGYWIYKYPVTVEQYTRYCTEMGVKWPDKPRWGYRHNHPVVNVSWHDATRYCAWAGVSLPKEVEWEKAARGTDGREFPWQGPWDASKCANSVGEKRGSTAPVTQHPGGASPFGAWDMAGNVWEWCDDWYEEGKYRVLRGGAWINYDGVIFRCACRNWYAPDVVNDGIGLRGVSRPGSS